MTRAGERVVREEPDRERRPSRPKRAAPVAPDAPERSSLRVVRGKPGPAKAAGTKKAVGKGRAPAKARGATKGRAKAGTRPVPDRERARRKPKGPQAVRDEILRLGGRRAERYHDQLLRAAEALEADRARDAFRLLGPLRAAMPGSPSVSELLGLSLYRLGRYPDAAAELEHYVTLTGAVDQHPVLMDCARAGKDYRRVERLWTELAETSPSAELVTEGRIVRAGALADRGRLVEAIALLERRGSSPRVVREHHLRLWYALADLEERSGNLPRARTLFQQVRQHDPRFADVAERLAALG